MPVSEFTIANGSNTSNWLVMFDDPKLSGLLLPKMTGTRITMQMRNPGSATFYDVVKPDGTKLELVASPTADLAYTAEVLSILVCFIGYEVRFISNAVEVAKRVIVLVQR